MVDRKGRTPPIPAAEGPRPKKAATLADVARAAGVVAMTASRAINSTGYVSDEVRERVLKAAELLHYRPNMQARYLKGQRLNAIGIMLPDIANPFSTELVNGMMEIFEQGGYTAFITMSGRGVDREQAGLQAFLDHRVDGLLVATLGTTAGDAMLAELATQNVPIVTIGRPVAGAEMDCVTANHWQGAFDATTHMIGLGHKRIGFIGISAADSGSLRRHQGYKAALEQAGLEMNPDYTVGPPVAPAFATQADGYEGMIRLGKLKKRPTAVLARNDFAAIGALHAAHRMAMAIPGDISIAGFDDIPLAAYTTPPLTTVQQPILEQGQLAARLLLDRIEGRLTGPSRVHTMDCKLVVRESTGVLPPAVAKKAHG
jgi:DNA-binding LacI/PurR family transcriptional regulator